MVDTDKSNNKGARCIAFVGPQFSGKTTLFEAVLEHAGVHLRSSIDHRHAASDLSPEAKEHGMSVELNVGEIDYLGDKFTLLDCPGSVEFQYDGSAALSACDAAVVVCEADEKKLPALQATLKEVEDRAIPHLLFLNKVDKTDGNIRQLLALLQPACRVPLVLRQLPMVEGGVVTGYIDLALERAFVYRERGPSHAVAIPERMTAEEAHERFAMLEKLADYDDELMEQLLEDASPSREKVFGDLVMEMRRGQICPVFFGSAEHGNGIRRLLKALRHEAPGVSETARRLGLEPTGNIAHIFKTYHTSHAGKLSLARVLSGSFADGDTVYGPAGEERVSGLFTLASGEAKKRGPVTQGDTVAFGRLESFQTGQTIAKEKANSPAIAGPAPARPVYSLAVFAGERKDEIKLTAALAKLIEEDPSLSLQQDREAGQMVLWGQGEMHLRVTLERLARRFSIAAQTARRRIAYKETIRKGVEIRGRLKKQSGGHGQFGDVVVDIIPKPRGEGFEFTDVITGGVVPKNYIPAVENGVREALASGPLGFPVVDVSVCLKDGSYHTVDSSDQAFRAAGRIAVTDGLPKCSPVLLEPIMAVKIAVPSEATPKINAMIPARRGQILGFDGREGWPGWDVVDALIPDAETLDLIIELRSATAGAGSFTADFAHFAELTGRMADQIVEARAAG